MNNFVIQSRVYYEDTDAGGIVYHANYLKYMERARTEWVRALGISQQNLLEQSLAFVVIDMNIAFKQSAKLDDVLHISCEVIQKRGASLRFAQEVRKNNTLLVSAEVTVACVNTKRSRATAIPKDLLNAIN
ncbi:MAG: acyl-CoA thioester hydrolase [Alphaproteobacteria bacterium]|jgi:acyl-CoA thioester hydrolase